MEAPENFLTKRQWDGLLDKTETLQSNMIMLAGLWFKLGLKSPSEPTARNITAIAMLHEPDFVITSQQGVAASSTSKFGWRRIPYNELEAGDAWYGWDLVTRKPALI